MSPVEVEWRPSTLDALRAELPNLRKRRAFVAGAEGTEGVEVRKGCDLVIVHPVTGSRLRLPAEVVWVQADGPGKGVGVELGAFDAEGLAAFVESVGEEPVTPTPAEDAPAPNPDPGAAEDDEPSERDGRAKGLYEKVRAFSIREREVCARSGTLPERTALERCYGTSVWEGILQNPQATPPEVARIARNGTISNPMLGLIVANAGWLAVGEVQRALLSNPRVGGAHLDRVLRALTPAELRRVIQQTAYRALVRQAAQKLAK